MQPIYQGHSGIDILQGRPELRSSAQYNTEFLRTLTHSDSFGIILRSVFHKLTMNLNGFRDDSMQLFVVEPANEEDSISPVELIKTHHKMFVDAEDRDAHRDVLETGELNWVKLLDRTISRSVATVLEEIESLGFQMKGTLSAPGRVSSCS